MGLDSKGASQEVRTYASSALGIRYIRREVDYSVPGRTTGQRRARMMAESSTLGAGKQLANLRHYAGAVWSTFIDSAILI